MKYCFFDLCLNDGEINKNFHRKFIDKKEKLIAQLVRFRKHLKTSSK